MKKFITLLFLFFTKSIFAAADPIEFCSTAELDFSLDDCYASCTALQDNNIFLENEISSGSAGFCLGQATYSKFKLYKIALGNSSSDESLCTIWEKTDGQEFIKSSYLPGSSIDLGTGTSCPAGTYDVLFITTSNFDTFAGETTFPSAAGGTFRTTSDYASDSVFDYDDTVSDWLDQSSPYNTTSKPYIRPSSSWNTVYKKVGDTPLASTASQFSGSNSQMIIDWNKEIVINYSDTTSRPGWRCEPSSLDGDAMCAKLETDRYTERMTTEVEGVQEGLPVTVTADDILTFNVDYISNSQDRSDLTSNRELGLKVLFLNDGGTVKAMGVYPGEDGRYIIITKTPPKN